MTKEILSLRCQIRDPAGHLWDKGQNVRTITLGHDEVIPGLEALVRDRPVGYRGRHRIAARDAFGEHRPELVFTAVRENLPQDIDIQVGSVLHPGGMEGRYPLRVVALTDKGVVLDGNHPLAGQELEVDLEVISRSWRGQ